MYRDLKPLEYALAQEMSRISEDTYCAGWMDDLEYHLWRALLAGGEYGSYRLDSRDLDRLRTFSELCGGWIYFDDENGETFIELAEWEKRFQAHEAASGTR